MGITDKINQEDLEYLHLKYFINVLNFSLSGTSKNAFDLLRRYLDKGLSLYYTKEHHPTLVYCLDEIEVFTGDSKKVLIRLENLTDIDKEQGYFIKHEPLKSPEGVPIGNLIIKRSDVEKVYLKCEQTEFPWALVHWPQADYHWDWFPVNQVELLSINATVKPETRNQKRLRILTEWYADLCRKHKNNKGSIIGEINSLSNADILSKLADITPSNEKHLWVSGAKVWLGQNGKTVWGVVKIQGLKSTKRI